MSDSNKSGYAIRADLLGMAIGILQSRESRYEANEHFKAEGNRGYQRQPVEPFTTDDVLDVAEKLYGFVKKK